jgi:Ca-activated chloride channel family protein
MMRKIILSVILMGMPAAAQAGLSKKIAEGNKLFEEGNFDGALTSYNDAQIESPASPEIFFNMGTVYYRQEKFEEAKDAFHKSMEKGDIELEAKALYNIGNSLFRQGRLKEALDYYKQSLERNPDDMDTKYNIEYTEKKIKEMLSKSQETRQKAMQDQAQRQQQQKSGNDGRKDERDKDRTKGSQTAAAKEDGEEKKDEKIEESDKGRDEQAQESRPEDKKEMTKEEAENFLSAFDQDQKNLLPPEQKDARPGRSGYVEKDW